MDERMMDEENLSIPGSTKAIRVAVQAKQPEKRQNLHQLYKDLVYTAPHSDYCRKPLKERLAIANRGYYLASMNWCINVDLTGNLTDLMAPNQKMAAYIPKS
jgi:hypothetical protein